MKIFPAFLATTLIVGLGLTLSAQEQFRLPLTGESCYLSTPGSNPGKLEWNDKNTEVSFLCSVKPKHFNWGYLAVKVPRDSVKAGVTRIRISVMAELPDGLTLSVVLSEEAISYDLSHIQVEPGQWGTLTLPLNRFKPSAWNRHEDDDKKFDPDQCQAVMVGFSGRPAAAAPVRVSVREITFLP